MSDGRAVPARDAGENRTMQKGHDLYMKLCFHNVIFVIDIEYSGHLKQVSDGEIPNMSLQFA